MTPVVMELETNDPDDFLTLLFALESPDIEIKAINLVPGFPEQIGLIQWALSEHGKTATIPVGCFDIDNKNNRKKSAVSNWHNKLGFSWKSSTNAQDGCSIIREHVMEDVVYFIGSPPRNIGKYLKDNKLKCKSIVFQGGFAGDSLVKKENRLPKFDGKETCPTFNLNGHKKSTMRVLEQSVSISFVSKNVCHGILYDKEFHETIKNRHKLIYDFMSKTYIKLDKVKALHDPFAFSTIIDDSIVEWKKVDLYCIKGEWGSVANVRSNKRISISGNKDKFVQAILR